MSRLARNQVVHDGYDLTLATLHERFAQFSAIFARHGIATSRNRLDSVPPDRFPLDE
jgi:hypothetical protein